MKKYLLLLLIILPFTQYTIQAQSKKNYSIKLKVNGLKDSTCYLAHFYLSPKSQIIKDTTVCDANGNIEFKGDTELPKGIYIISVGTSKSIQLIIGNDSEIEMETDTTYDHSKLRVIRSEENKVFYDYQNTMAEKNKEFQNLNTIQKKQPDIKVTEMIKALQEGVMKYQKDFFEKNKNSIAAKLLKAPQQPNIPEAPKLQNGGIDSTFSLRWIQNHYFDNMDLSDEMFIKTPYLEGKIDYYLDNLTYQIPDSLSKAADFIMKKAQNTRNMQRYFSSHIASRYERPNFMGGDAVFVHMAEKYFLGMPSLWDSATLAPINEKKIAVKNVLLGQKIQNAQLVDTTGNQLITLYDLNAKYTLMFLYDPECSHCKERAPKILSFYEKMKSKGLKVFAASTVNDLDKMKTFIKTMKTAQFINVYDKFSITDFRSKYNVYTTPQVILLDKDKKIIGRGLEEDQMEDLINKMERMTNK
ncbi:MAG: redoxin domain-containing protein [Bacteroidota bacterium]